MNWMFWKKKKEIEQKTSTDEILKEEIIGLQKKVENLEDQMNKMVRIQFKTGKNMEEKMEEFGSFLTEFKKENELIVHYKNREKMMASHIIRLLDELDHVVSKLDDTEQGWHKVFTQWINTLLKNLQEIGIYQLNVIDKSFDPKIAESIKTVTKNELYTAPKVPYQIVQIIHRGYISESGELIRKAKVVTVKEDE